MLNEKLFTRRNLKDFLNSCGGPSFVSPEAEAPNDPNSGPGDMADARAR